MSAHYVNGNLSLCPAIRPISRNVLHTLAPRPGKSASRSCRHLFALAALLGALWVAPHAHAQDALLTNGSFETGNLSGWTTAASGDGSFQLGTTANDGSGHYLTPGTQSFSVGPKSGFYYAVSDGSSPDNAGPGAHALLQSFTLSGAASHVLLSFDMFVNDYNGAGALNVGGALDPTQATPTQYARVDILKGTASALSTDVSDILVNLYAGEDAGNPPNAYTHYQFDLTSFLPTGSTYQVRFAEVDNQFVLNQGVDNVSLTAITPEPGTLGLLLGLTAFGGLLKTRLRRK